MKWLALLFCGVVSAHEMTPAYPVFQPSHIDGVSKVNMEMFNRRADVEYYELGVFDKSWNSIPFVSSYSIAKIAYLGHLKFEVFVKDADIPKVEYICSRSLIRRTSDTEPLISSKICSRVKK